MDKSFEDIKLMTEEEFLLYLNSLENKIREEQYRYWERVFMDTSKVSNLQEGFKMGYFAGYEDGKSGNEYCDDINYR